jgi:hypothetical protein
MTFKSKYIILECNGLIMPVVFSDLMSHSDVLNNLARAQNLRGAGFCYINDSGTYTCYGRSSGLDRDADPERDSAILNRYLGVVQDD